jgi:hypothetical protein
MCRYSVPPLCVALCETTGRLHGNEDDEEELKQRRNYDPQSRSDSLQARQPAKPNSNRALRLAVPVGGCRPTTRLTGCDIQET